VHSLSLKRCPPSQAYKSLEHFSAVALGVVDRLNPTSIFLPFKKNNDPAEAGPPVSLCSDELANRPASVWVANSTAPGCYHDRRDDRHAWSHHSAAVVNAAVVAIATAAAIGAAVKARSTATGDRNCQTSLSLVERRKGHGLGGGNAEDTDADGDCDGKKLRHSFLLSCCVM
jgi:hypothetical protein